MRACLFLVVLGSLATVAAQQPNTPDGTLLLEGGTSSLTRVAGDPLAVTLRGGQGQPVVLVSGTPGSIPVPQLGLVEVVPPYQIYLNGADPGHPLNGQSILGFVSGELIWNTSFDPSLTSSPVAWQALVGDPAMPGGFRLTASVTVTEGSPPPVLAGVPVITRGPQLEQIGTSSALLTVHVTPLANVEVDVGPPGGGWTTTFYSTATGPEHVVALNGLQTGTTYAYRVRWSGGVLVEGPEFRFHTAPPTGGDAPVRFFAWGDFGKGNPEQVELSSFMEELEPRPDFCLLLGDLIYPDGNAELYDENFFLPYRRLIQSMALWPAIGNHDTIQNGGQAYYDNFHLPTGSPGGEKYYSFDYGNIHFVCIDGETSLHPNLGMVPWIAADLAASTQQWKIAYLHRPVYTGGTLYGLTWFVNNLVPVFDAHGVDLMLAGHSHTMERSYLLANHNIIQNDPHEYDKSSSSTGTLYAVSGAGFQALPLFVPNHPLFHFQLDDRTGTLVVEVQGPVLRGYFLDANGTHLDHFTISKGPDSRAPEVASVKQGTVPSEIIVVFDEPVQDGAGPGGAENLAHYLLDGNAVVQAASLASDMRTVTLQVPLIGIDAFPILTVSGVNDRAQLPNVVATSAVPVRCDPWRRHVVPKSRWRIFEGTQAPPAMWAERDFDDTAWLSGQGRVGFSSNPYTPVATHLNMEGNYVTFYVRRAFRVDDPTSITGVRLEVDFDDGFVAYLNGHEIARKDVPVGQSHTSPGDPHKGGYSEPYFLDRAVRFLLPGKNVLAFEVHNENINNNDCFIDASLALRSTDRPSIRLWANGVTGHDHGTRVSVPVSGPLDLRIEVGPASVAQAVQLSLSTDLRDGPGLSAALLGPEIPLLNHFPSTGGTFDFTNPNLHSSLAGSSFTVQAFHATPFGASNALTLDFVP